MHTKGRKACGAGKYRERTADIFLCQLIRIICYSIDLEEAHAAAREEDRDLKSQGV